MGLRLNLVGKIYGRLKVLKYNHTDKSSKAVWLCICECGNEHLVSTDLLNRGNLKSCGCLRKDKIVSPETIKAEVLMFMKKHKRTPSKEEMKNKNIFSLQYSPARKKIGGFKLLAEKYNIKLMRSGLKYYFNFKYFEIIDSPDKAYFLGFLAADGTIREDGVWTVRLKIHEKDKDILGKFKKCIEANNPIKYDEGKNAKVKRSPQYSLTLGDKSFVKSINKFSITSKKSFTILFPGPKLLPIEHQSSFIRGVYDGDGTLGKRSGQASIVSASLRFLEGINKVFKSNNILNIYIKKRKNYNFYELTINSSGYYGEGKSVKRFPGRINSLNIYKFYKFIYQDKTDLFLKRKKETIENHLKEANKNSIDDIVFY